MFGSFIVTVQTLKLEHLEEDCPISTFLKTWKFLYMLCRLRKFEDIPTIDKVFEQNIKRPLKISAKGKARQVVLRFREAFNVGLYFRERRKTALKNSRGSNHS